MILIVHSALVGLTVTALVLDARKAEVHEYDKESNAK